MSTHFSILGAGAWGTAVALVLAQKPEHRVSLWCARPETFAELHKSRENVRLLPGVMIPPTIQITADITEATAGSELLVVAIPTIHLRPALERVADKLPKSPPVLSLVKGIERHTFLRPTQIVRQYLPDIDVAVLSGPSHAEEVSRGQPTSVVVAAENLSLARWIQNSMSTDRFRIYTNLDVLGVELAGALKNIMGIAAGISDGLELGDNAKAALLTRGLVEMTRFGVAVGAEPQTFYGLAGIGDLIATCFSRHGRNRAVGERLGRGEPLTQILAGMSKIAEGVYTTQSVHEQAMHMDIAMPITKAVHQVMYENKPPLEAVNELMVRTAKSEK